MCFTALGSERKVHLYMMRGRILSVTAAGRLMIGKSINPVENLWSGETLDWLESWLSDTYIGLVTLKTRPHQQSYVCSYIKEAVCARACIYINIFHVFMYVFYILWQLRRVKIMLPWKRQTRRNRLWRRKVQLVNETSKFVPSVCKCVRMFEQQQLQQVCICMCICYARQLSTSM